MEVFVEVIGYIGMAIILCSSLMTTVKWIRIVNICGSILCATYGILTVTIPTVALNVGLMLINLSFLIVLIRKEKGNKNNNIEKVEVNAGAIQEEYIESNASTDKTENKNEVTNIESETSLQQNASKKAKNKTEKNQ